MNNKAKIIVVFLGGVAIIGTLFMLFPLEDTSNTEFKPIMESSEITENNSLTTGKLFTYIKRHDEASYTFTIERQVDTSSPPKFQSVFGTVSRSNRTYYIIETASTSNNNDNSVYYYHQDGTTHINQSQLDSIETRNESYSSKKAFRTDFLQEFLKGLTYEKKNETTNKTTYSLVNVSNNHPLNEYNNISSTVVITENSVEIRYSATKNNQYIQITAQYTKLQNSNLEEPSWLND